MDSLSDATVVITGASSGIGLAAARAFATRGANVVLAARRRELLQRAAQDCEELGGPALAVPTDVTDPERVRDLTDAAINAFGGIDVWVNNAGTSMWGRFEQVPLESQARLVELNLLGAINGCHAVVPHLLERGGRGVIINVSSVFGRVPMPFAAAYSASKAGLAGFTEALRVELAPSSEIEVCGVYPAYVDTPTYLNSANYTGRALRPVPPVVPPERVAERIVGLALRPRRSVRVGSLNALAVPHAIAPDAAGRLVARLGWRFLFRSGPAASDSDGGLFGTVAGRAEARGDWGVPERRRARRTVAVAAVLAAGVYGYLLSRRARDARGASRGERTRCDLRPTTDNEMGGDVRRTFKFRPESRQGRKPEEPGTASPFFAYLSVAQGLYYAATALWSLLSVGTFQRVTGPKTDVWLVKTVGVLVGAIGCALVVAGFRRARTPEIGLLGAASAAGLAGIDAYYAGRRRISAVYLLDALAELILFALWLYALIRERH